MTYQPFNNRNHFKCIYGLALLALSCSEGHIVSSDACGNGLVDAGETCDGSCPVACNDGLACTTDVLAGAAEQCSAVCSHAPITACQSGDGCCAPGCNAANDSDCAVACGNGVVEAGEACDDMNANEADGCSSTCRIGVMGLATSVHSCALLGNGKLRCWGRNQSGQLGIGNASDIGDEAMEFPYTVGDVTLASDVRVTQVSTAIAHTCAMLGSGNVRCWGQNDVGQLGYGDTTSRGNSGGSASLSTLPDVALGTGATVSQVSARGSNTCVVLSNGKVRCWGAGGSGQLGIGNTNTVGDDEVPTIDVTLASDVVVTQIAVGGAHACVLLSTGAVRCWGSGSNGRLGYGDTATRGDTGGSTSLNTLPDINLGAGVVATQVAAGGSHSCALTSNGGVLCWGQNNVGQLGIGNSNDIGDSAGEMPPPAVNLGMGAVATQVVTAGQHTCALLSTGGVRCWGEGALGRLGYGNTTTLNAPAGVDLSLGESVARLGLGGSEHLCALLVSGAVRCWGNGANGRLGYGNVDNIGDSELPSTTLNVQILTP